jgi:hypothetical protein
MQALFFLLRDFAAAINSPLTNTIFMESADEKNYAWNVLQNK